MNENKPENFGGVYKAAIGGALLGMAIVDQVTKTIVPAMQKLSLNEALEELKMLPSKEVEQHNDKEEHDQQKQYEDEEKYKQKDEEISELKRKLAELENK